MLRRFGPIALLATATAATVLVCLLLGASHQVLDRVVIGAALVAGCMVDLRPAGRAPLPVALAIIPVLLRAATPDEFVVVVATAALVAAVSRRDLKSIAQRLLLLAELLAAAYGAGAVFRVIAASTSSSSRIGVLGALAAAATMELVIADLVALERDRRIAGLRDRAADVVVVSSGILMAVGYGGLAGHGRLGLWGPLLFAIPLVAAWYSFELLVRTRRTFRQTVQALGVAPELGGLTRAGHVERGDVLAMACGQELCMPDAALEDVE